MSRHSTSFQAEARVPAEVVAELLPQPIPGKSDPENAASATPAPPSMRFWTCSPAFGITANSRPPDGFWNETTSGTSVHPKR